MSFFGTNSTSTPITYVRDPNTGKTYGDASTSTLAATPTTTSTSSSSTSTITPSTVSETNPAQAPSYAAKISRKANFGGMSSTILTSGAGLTTRAQTAQKTLLGQ